MSTAAERGPEVASLAELAGRLAECEAGAPCTHMVYVRSPAMPLSERGVPEIVEATRSFGVPLSILPAHILFEPEAQLLLDELRMALVEAGATVHFPAVVIVNDGTPVGNALVGYKPAEVYESILGRRLGAQQQDAALTELTELTSGTAPPAPAAVAPPAAHTAATASAAPTAPAVGDVPTRDVELLAAYPLPSRPGAFFRRAPGTRYISFDLESVVYLHHLESNERFSAPGRLDFVPSPDGAFFVTPGARYAGLQFYSAREIFRLGARNQARVLAPLLVDETLRDEYPSIGIFGREADGSRIRYRVLTAWREGAQYRDYELKFDGAGEITGIRPLSRKTGACQDLQLSLPILSKDGREMSARDESTGTTKVFRLGANGACREVFDAGMQTTKATFSYDGELLAFGSRDGQRRQLGDARPAIYVVDRRTGETTRIPQSTSRSLTIPEFVGPDILLFLVAGPRANNPAELRLVCCVR
jgi:hypothetical protein